MISWLIVAILALVPFNWFRLWLQGEIPPSATLLQAVAGVAPGGVSRVPWASFWW